MSRTYRSAPAYGETPVRRRVSGLGLAIGINLLVVLALLTLGERLPPGDPSSAIVVDLLPQSDRQEAARARTEAEPEAKPVPVKRPPPSVPEPPKIALPSNRPLPWIEMTSAEFAASDVRNMPEPAVAAAAGAGAGDSEEVGRAPNGEILYAAEWARRPTSAELRGYIPKNAPDGWGMVACKTVPGNRVDECLEIGQSPLGSRLASAVRQAAWQFRVRPPRKNGVPMIGVWVRIRIDYETIRG